jgi:DNA-binding transcriptional regulator YiaG
MPKYTNEKKASLAAAGERMGIIGKTSKVMVNINERGTMAKHVGAPRDQIKKHRETQSEFHARMLATYKIKPLQKIDLKADHDVTNPTRYKAVAMWNAGTIAQKNILERYKYAMREQGILPSDLSNWREYYMLLSREQLASIIRVDERTIRNWETGKSEIPFSIWWFMHTSMQDPAYFLTRPGFHDFYIDYENGEAFLCCHSHPEIRYTPTDLYFNRMAFAELLSCRRDLQKAQDAFDALQLENTRLREMYKTNAVSKELAAMHEYIGQLVSRLNTADVVQFQPMTQAVPASNNSSIAA